MEDNDYYMDICTELANTAKIKGNPAVGCIIVKNGEIIARAEEASKSKSDITCHAEIEVIREAVKKIGNNLSQCTLYTTHEPCVMCAYPIRFYSISKIIINSKVNTLGGAGPDFPLLTTNKVPAHWAAPPEMVWLNDSVA
ncbi:MAG: nucleoside deaminase [Ferruginibacter sp.]